MGKVILGQVSLANTGDVASSIRFAKNELNESISVMRRELDSLEILVNEEKVGSIDSAISSLREGIANMDTSLTSLEARVSNLEDTAANTELTSMEVREEYERW